MTASDAASILLVEDNQADADLVEEALNEYRVPVTIVVLRDGEEAVRFVEESDLKMGPCPRLVILDLNLPKRSGKEVLRCIRERNQWKNIPVVIFSSSDSPSDREQTARLGASQYIRKPSQLEEFLAIGGVIKDLLTGVSS
jgi:two-component system, chemotaxis family, response regulator Rcp1